MYQIISTAELHRKAFERVLNDGVWPPDQLALLLREQHHFLWMCTVFSSVHTGVENIVDLWRVSGSGQVTKVLKEVSFESLRC